MTRYSRNGFEDHIDQTYPTMASVLVFERRGKRTLLVRSTDSHAIHAVEHIAVRAGLKPLSLSQDGDMHFLELLGFQADQSPAPKKACGCAPDCEKWLPCTCACHEREL